MVFGKVVLIKLKERFLNKLHLTLKDKNFSEILKGSVYSFLAKIIANIVGLITGVFIARYYGADVMGLLAIILTTVGIAGMLSSAGLPMALLKLIPEYTNRFSLRAGVAIYIKIVVLVIVFTAIVSVGLFFLSDIIANKIFHNKELISLIALVPLFLLFSTLNGINILMIRALKKIKLYAILEFLPKVIILILLLIITYTYYDKYNPIYTLFFMFVVMFMITSYYIFKITNQQSHENFDLLPSYSNIISLSWPMFLTGGLQIIMAQTDTIMLGMYSTIKDVGVYSVVFSLSMLTVFVLNSINVMSAPKFSELYHQNKMAELEKVARQSTKLIFWSTLPIIFVLIVFGKFILGLYGDEFKLGYYALLFLVIGQFFNASAGSVGYFLNMTGHQKEFRNIVFFAAVVNVLLNYYLIPIYGVSGAAFASMISVIIWNGVALIYIKLKFGFFTGYLPLPVKIKGKK